MVKVENLALLARFMNQVATIQMIPEGGREGCGSIKQYLENGLDFDQYEPYYSDDKRELDEHINISPLARSPRRKSQEITGNTYNPKSQDACYLCWDMGNKMHKCRLGLKRNQSRSRGRLSPGGDTVPMRHLESDRDTSTSRNRHKFLGRGNSAP
ncbi:hypothetical protein BUALT_Bualt11G0091200 [Buddleja alternifolia]|uniref:Uncharacterized protein n=1 Tax=Buddleja alternifolia TaxID=168488 RepID=A0AAV6X0X3_9LAMI|nr:hypothetical protein BUALT_Bualt11G0091200 [Buddleja alternifolia]